MAKKSVPKGSSGKSYAKPFILITLLLGVVAGYALWHDRDRLESYFLSPDKDEVILCFEAKLTPELLQQRLEQNLGRNSSQSNQRNNQITWAEGRICYIPHLLVDVKYTLDGKRTQTGRMLWDLTRSELLLDTLQFETTRGFQDCLQSEANAEDFRILRLLSQNKGTLSREVLIRELALEEELVNARIDSLRKKQLILKTNETIRIHVDDPILGIEPTTKITLPLSKITVKHHYLLPQEQTQQQLLSMIQVAFGPTLAIRGYKKLYLPVVELNVVNPDGSITTSHWNAINGRQRALDAS